MVQRPIKAYSIGDGDEWSQICFHYSAREAKREFWNRLDGELDEFIHCVVRRCPDGDRYAPESPQVIPWGQSNSKIYWMMGWWPEETDRQCYECERYEYEEIPESTVVELNSGDYVCADCLERACSKFLSGEVDLKGDNLEALNNFEPVEKTRWHLHEHWKIYSEKTEPTINKAKTVIQSDHG